MDKMFGPALAVAVAAMVFAGSPAAAPAQSAGYAQPRGQGQSGTYQGQGANQGQQPSTTGSTQRREEPGATGRSAQQPGTVRSAQRPGTTGSAQQPDTAMTQGEGNWQERVTGTVVDVNRKRGTLTLSPGGNTRLVMQFPPDSLQGIKAGDTITASMSVTSTGHGARAYDVPRGRQAERLQGQHQVSGTVETVDRAKGFVTVQVEKGTTMRLRFPPEALQGVSPGDQITVNLGFSKGNLQQGSTR